MKDLFELPFEPVPSRRILSVTELTVGVRDLLETQFSAVWVEGELSNCRIWNTGHLYFTLKDAASQVRGVMFRSALRYLKFKPADGLTVVARGSVTVYEPKGKNTGAAVVVFPGGGYHILAVDLEGTEVCDWLNSVGIAWVLVNYRVPASGLVPNRRPHCRTRSELTAWFVHAPAGGTLIRSASGSSDSLRERTCRRLSALTSNSDSTIRSMTPTRLAAVPILR